MRGTLRDQFRDKHPFFWVVVVAAVYAAGVFAFSVVMQYKYMGMGRDGFDWDGQLRVITVFSGGPAEGKLQVGDQILAMDGRPVTRNGFSNQINSKPVGAAYVLEVVRNGVKQQVDLKITLYRSPDRSVSVPFLILVNLVTLGFLILAILAGFLRPSDATVRHFFTAFYFTGILATPLNFLYFNATEMLIWKIIRTFPGTTILLPVFFLLCLRFPPGISVSRFWNFVTWAYFVVDAAMYLDGVWELWGGTGFINSLFGQVVFLSHAPVIVLVMIRNYRLVTEAQQRRRIKWIIFSTIATFSSFFILIAGGEIVRRTAILVASVERPLFILLSFTSQLFLLSIPAAWFYAILKHRVLDISVVIRRSLRYLLASRGFILIEALLAFALLSFIFAGRLGVWLDRFGSNTRTLITILGTVLMVLGLQTVNRKIRPLIDRRFFREAYDAQQILTELTSSLRATTNVNQVLELTTAKIQQALYAANVTIFLRNGQHDFRSAVSRDYHEREKSSQSVARELHLPDEAFVVQRIHDSSQPAEIDWDDPYSPVATQLAAMANGDAAAQQEFDTLRELKTNLVLPLAAKDELLGVLALGPRAGDLPYSREDKRMLMNVAGQTAMALENSHLVERMIEEARRREEIEAENEARAKELEEARQLQLSLLPKQVPQLPHLDIAAYMKTASEVGGDYYDFHLAEDGTLTIAIGDATGHGLRAGTLVASVKSLFVSLAYHPDIAHIFTRMSRVLKEMKLRGLFMAMTMAKVKGNQMSVSIAGMPSVLIYRAASQAIEEIAMRALPLGGVTKYQYQQQELKLAANDVVVLMSDGLPERFNPQGEMLDAERIRAALPALAAQSSEAIIAALVRLGDEWGAGRAQDDDITFVVLKIRANTFTEQDNL